LLISLFI